MYPKLQVNLKLRNHEWNLKFTVCVWTPLLSCKNNWNENPLCPLPEMQKPSHILLGLSYMHTNTCYLKWVKLCVFCGGDCICFNNPYLYVNTVSRCCLYLTTICLVVLSFMCQVCTHEYVLYLTVCSFYSCLPIDGISGKFMFGMTQQAIVTVGFWNVVNLFNCLHWFLIRFNSSLHIIICNY